jgi:hypothetical protein
MNKRSLIKSLNKEQNNFKKDIFTAKGADK